MPSLPPTFRTAAQERARLQAAADYRARRGSMRQHGYDSRWDRASRVFKRANPLCLGCEAIGRTAATEITDHVVPHKGNMDVFWDSARWQPACRWHHDSVKQQLEAMFARGEITEAELWLDSDRAKALSRGLLALGG